jgi:hypothetical protein
MAMVTTEILDIIITGYKNHMLWTRYASHLQVEWELDRTYCGGPIRNS